jgi:hypothetical protein
LCVSGALHYLWAQKGSFGTILLKLSQTWSSKCRIQVAAAAAC